MFESLVHHIESIDTNFIEYIQETEYEVLTHLNPDPIHDLDTIEWEHLFHT